MIAVERCDFETLRKHHAELEGLIKAEYNRPHPDDIALKRMKIEKLYVKEAMDQKAPH